ncbi:acyl-homoserine-lactone synthase [Albidovulum sediminicola]|uniref:Acyl-homoserine-lactone synthase n=1 Tax=Albidovulum sediminicola TaxID=2984331 RepID=A0ABT2Z2G9_9RHOB|nr:acyl-homoserine-lactone synthase [Defluviimonas sp. WL0075]MCV2865311.1 autoinducer synthase [Defluviimonas sp. WL0075]
MLRFLTGEELSNTPKLRDTMYADRACQFRDRLNWEVRVDDRGWERDEYDALNPLYVIWQRADGRHGGSMRFMPTEGRTMVNDHFRHLAGGRRISSARVWECTRFCLAAETEANVAAALMLGGAELGVRLGLTRAVGVFDARMVRIYRHLGWEPDILGSTGSGREAISLGFWRFSEEVRVKMAAKAGIPEALSQAWFASDRHEPLPVRVTG